MVQICLYEHSRIYHVPSTDRGKRGEKIEKERTILGFLPRKEGEGEGSFLKKVEVMCGTA